MLTGKELTVTIDMLTSANKIINLRFNIFGSSIKYDQKSKTVLECLRLFQEAGSDQYNQ
jgi:hypothetical protein